MTEPDPTIHALMTPAQAAKYLALSPCTLARMRAQGGGPRFCKTGDAPKSPVRYRVADLDAWVSSRLQAHTGALPGSAGEKPRRPPSSGQVD